MRVLHLWLACCWLAAPSGLFAAAPDETSDEPQPQPVIAEHVRVTATRLPDEPADGGRLPANMTLVSREEIERLGLVDLAEVLALEAGAVFYDQTGNDVQTTFDLRGFTDGSGTRLFLDGAPLNDALNDTASLELVPLEALERVEITRGSAAALAGGGSEAGVINLVTRRAEQLGGSLLFAAGSFATAEYGGHLAQDLGRVDFLIAGRRRETDGFRENADGELGRLSASVGVDLGLKRRLGLTLLAAESDFGSPGALTATEIQEDSSASPFNSLDFADESIGLATLSFHAPLAESLTIAANLFARDRDTESLTTGRAAPLFGGFAFESDAEFWGSTVQLTHRLEHGGRRNFLAFGGEWLDGDTDSLGFFTPADDPGTVPAAADTDTTSDRRTAALFVQDTWTPARRFTLMAGARYDRDRVALDERLPDRANDDSRSFSELSLRGGATFSPDETHALYLAYGEGFLPPTSEDLFAFPGFGSNPDLEPEDSRSYEIGFRRRTPRGPQFSVGLFRIDTENEIVFDPDSPIGPFGANVNAGKTRREGLEISLEGRAATRLDFFAELTLMQAEFEAGDHAGNDVPLVPRERLAAGLDLDLPAGLTLHADALYVGEQILDNDDANSQPQLDAYTVVNARLHWELSSVTAWRGAPRLFFETRNVFDEEYATRGIYAFDFSSGMNDAFFTPAPGRRHAGGAEWDF